MVAPLFTGQPDATPVAALELPTPVDTALRKPEGYKAGPDLVQAVEVALLLRQPLLLTGEPGVGKTRLAYALARELGLSLPIECFIASTTTKADLFYRIDQLRRFSDAQIYRGDLGAGDGSQSTSLAAPQLPRRRLRPLRDYLHFEGLGKALLQAGGPGCPLDKIPGYAPEPDEPELKTFFDLVPERAFWAGSPRLSVVLLDEMDKAPRDTPNDMLNEIDRMSFQIPELGVVVTAPADQRPIIVITSNSEKALPDPFLRRCIYFDIPFPMAGELRDIVSRRIWDALGRLGRESSSTSSALDDFVAYAVDLIYKLRETRPPLSRKPGIAEVLNFLSLLAMDHDLLRAGALTSHKDRVKRALPALVKTKEDLATAQHFVDAWTGPSPAAAASPGT